MKKRIFRYLKHIIITFVILGILAISFGLYHGASFRYAENQEMMNWDKDGPYVFGKNDSVLSVNKFRKILIATMLKSWQSLISKVVSEHSVIF